MDVPIDSSHVRKRASSAIGCAAGVEYVPVASDALDDDDSALSFFVAISAFVPDTQNLYVFGTPPSVYENISLP